MTSALHLLGFPPDTKLLIIHADDLGMCRSVNAATFRALDDGAITSASVMAPCVALAEVGEYARRNPGRDLGVHLTLTSEWTHHRWGPVLGIESVASLVDGGGHFFPRAQVNGWNLEEVRQELSAQIQKVKSTGVFPTHIDSHMLAVFGSMDLARAYVELGRQIGMPFLSAASLFIGALGPGLDHIISDSDIVVDNIFSLRPGLPELEWKNYYLRVLKSLKPGLNQLIVHLGYDDAELQAITSGHAFWGSAWRQRDYDAVMSEEFRSVVKEYNIQLVGWNQLSSIKQSATPNLKR